MITQIRGKLIEKNPMYVVVDCSGIGYFVNISLSTYESLPSTPEITLYTHLIVREDAHTLYGFLTKEERECFVLLLSVSGVGASTARTMLSSLTAVQLCNAIASADVVTIQSVKGIGAKTAQRIILDLREKVMKLSHIEGTVIAEKLPVREEALSALEVLGYVRKSAEKVVDKVLKGQDLPVEEVIKQSLKLL